MRFQVVSDPTARSAACHGLTRAAARRRRATVSALAAAACGLVMTACASQNSPGAASSAASSVGTTISSGSPSPASSDACANSQLKTGIIDTGALAGQAGGYLKFTNDSQTPCHMSGWPVVIGLTATGKATRLRHMQSTMFGAWHYNAPPPVVTLQPGDSAYVVVAADDQQADNTHCPAPYVRLRVSPPGDSGNVTISAWLPGANSYLPACTSADGSPTAGTSTITTLSSIAH
jgi:hypothetical protein